MALTKIPSSLLDTSGGFDLQGNITLGDNEQIQLGDSTDLAIYHDGSHSYIKDTGTGNLFIDATSLRLRTGAGTENYLVAEGNGAVTLYYDNNAKIATSSAGATVTGTLTVTGDLDITGNINSYNVTDLDVTDQTITLGAGQTEANSGGSGIIIDGSSASLLWNETNNRFDLSNDLKVGAEDSGQFSLEVSGGATGTAEGGELRLNTAADYDGTYNHYRLDVYEDDFRIGRAGTTDFYIFQDGLVKAENDFTVGGGLSVENGKLTINEFTGANAYTQIRKTNTGSNLAVVSQESIYMLLDENNDQTNRAFFIEHGAGAPGSGTTVFKVEESGNVGIAGATTIDDGNLQIGDANSPFNIAIAGTRAKFGYASDNAIVQGGTSKGIAFCVNNNTLGSGEAMRIDSSGNLLVGTTSTGAAAGGSGTSGININANGGVELARSANPVLFVNRTTSDGDIVQLRRDGSTVGTIGVVNGDRMYFSTADGLGLQFDKDNNRIVPCDAAGAYNNNIELGDSNLEFTNLWLSNNAYIGNVVGIGTTSPSYALDVYDVGEAWIRADSSHTTESTANSGLRFAHGGVNHGVLYHRGSDDALLYFDNIAGSTRFLIDSSGNVGIGTESPAKLGLTGSSVGKVLHLQGDDCQLRLTNTILHADNSGNTITHLRNNYGATSALAQMRFESGYHSWYTGTSFDEKMRLQNNTLYVSTDIGAHSNVTSFAHSTYAHAAVFGANSVPDGTVVIEDYDVSSGIGNTVLKLFLRDQDPATNAKFITFGDGGGAVGSIIHNDDGGGVTYNTTSDYRLKENVEYNWDATTLLKQLKPAKFNFKRAPGRTVQGMLAHEVSDIVPYSVTGEKDHMMEIGTIKDSEGSVIYEGVYEHFCKTDEGQTWTQTGTEPLYQELDYSRLVPLLTKAIQELNTKLEAAEARITELEG
jgi:hypothetical protein